MSAKILLKFVEKDINLSPEAYKKIISLEDPLNFTSSLIVKIKSQKISKSELISLDEGIVDEFIKKLGFDSSAIEESTMENSSIKDSNLENSSIEESTMENSSIKDSNLENSSMEESTMENSSIKDSNLENSSIKDSTMENSAIEDSVIKNLNIENSAIKNSTMEEFSIKNSTNENSVMENSATESSLMKSSVESVEIASTTNLNNSNISTETDIVIEKTNTIAKEGSIANTESNLTKNIENEITPLTNEIKRNLSEPSVKFDFKVIQDTSKKSYTSGELSNLISYFKNRYDKLSNILSKRAELRVHHKISDITDDTQDINIIGMIKDIWTTKNSHRMIEIEDETGEISVLVHKDNRDLIDDAEKLVKDEVIGLIATHNRNLIMASQIIHPGVQRVQEKEMDFAAVFISDIHIGSMTFLEEAFVNFTKWLNGDYGTDAHREIANDVKYLLIAGDTVDGIGVYPNQDKELAIRDITSQYDEAARLLGEVRSDIKIVIGPGNHDASRGAEPQPAIPEKYAKSLYELNNIEFISNPGIVSLDGITTLMYHGRGFDDMAMTVKGMSHQKNELIMEEFLKKRHLAPIYGDRTPIASELEDYLVIDNVPDVFHTGHVHINRYKKYHGVHMINSGTFQTQTEFQKIYNIVPTSGEVAVLHKGIYKQLKFV